MTANDTMVDYKAIMLDVVNREITNLMRYLTRDASWRGCFGVAIDVDGMIVRLKQHRLTRGILWPGGASSDTDVAEVIEAVALQRGITVCRSGLMTMVVSKEDQHGT